MCEHMYITQPKEGPNSYTTGLLHTNGAELRHLVCPFLIPISVSRTHLGLETWVSWSEQQSIPVSEQTETQTE